MKLDRCGCVYGAQVLLRHLTALDDEFSGVREGAADIEFIHRMRVATRRLRAALALFDDCLPGHKSKAWLKEIRKITTALGAARDADVQIEHLAAYRAGLGDAVQRSGVDRLLLRLRQQRGALQPGLELALDRLAERGVLGQMRLALEVKTTRAELAGQYSLTLYRRAQQAIGARVDELLAYNEIVPDPARVTELHQMRITAKRLRYTLEAFSGLYPDELKKWLKVSRAIQDTLGTIHDCDVWTAYIPLYLEEERARGLAFYGHTRTFPRLVPGVTAYAELRRGEREGLHHEFAEDWQGWMENNLWDRLRSALDEPVLAAGQAGRFPAVADLLAGSQLPD